MKSHPKQKQCTQYTPSFISQDLAELSQVLMKCLGLADHFRAEAAIVNYYPMDATLGGHTDHSEPNMEAPLLSISLGKRWFGAFELRKTCKKK